MNMVLLFQFDASVAVDGPVTLLQLNDQLTPREVLAFEACPLRLATLQHLVKLQLLLLVVA